MPTTTYHLGTANNSFIGAANREDLMDIVTIISPVDTPLTTMFPKAKVSNVQTEWLTDSLDAASSNAKAEGSAASFQTATQRVRLLNYCQISREAYEVSDTQRAVNPAGIRDEFRYQMGKGLKQYKRDVECDVVNGNTASGASTRCSRGIFYWLQGFSSKTANTTTTAGNLQEDDLNAALQRVWVTGGLVDYVVCTPTQKAAISNTFSGSTASRRNIGLTEMTVVNVIDIYMSDFGTVKVLPHRWFDNTATPGTLNMQRATFFLQSDKWVMGILRPPRNVPLAKVGSSERAMIEGEWTLVCLHPSANAFVSAHAAGTDGDNFPTN
jgi:hypothetical protein